MAFVRAIRAGKTFVEVFADSSKLVRGLKKAKIQLQRFGTQVRNIGAKIGAVTIFPVLGLGKAAIIFARFEQSMARVQALTNATAREFDRLSDKAKLLGRTTVFTADQAAQAMSFFALAGLDVKEILDAIGPTLNLAAAGQIEVAQAADFVVKTIKGMGIATSETTRVVDVLTAAMTTANTTLEQFGDAMKFVGPVARDAGLSLEEAAAAIQILSNAGLQATLAGTGLRGILIRLANLTPKATIAFKKLGVTVVDLAGEMRPFADIIEDLERGLNSLPSGTRLKLIGEIFPVRQAAAASVLIAEGADELRKFTKALEEAGGTADRVAGIQLNTLRGGFTILTSALEGLGIAVGSILSGPFRVLIATVTDVIRVVIKWVKANKALVIIIATATAAAIAVTASFIGLGLAMQIISFSIGGILFGMAALKSLFLVLIFPVTLLVGLLVGLGTQFKIMKLVSLALLSPLKALGVVVGLITGLFGSLLGGVVAVGGGIVSFLLLPLALAKRGFVLLGKAIKKVKGLFGALVGAVTRAFSAVKNVVKAMVVLFVRLFTVVRTGIVAMRVALLSLGVAGVVVNVIIAAAIAIVTVLATVVFKTIRRVVTSTIGLLVRAVKSIAGLARAIAQIVSSVVSSIIRQFRLLVTAMGQLTVRFKLLGKQISASMKFFVKQVKSGLAVFVLGFKRLLRGIDRLIRGVADAVKTGNIDLALKILMANLKVIWLKGITTITEMWTDGLNQFREFVGDTWRRIKDLLFKIWTAIQERWINLVFDMKNQWAEFVTFVKKEVAELQAVFAKFKLSLTIALPSAKEEVEKIIDSTLKSNKRIADQEEGLAKRKNEDEKKASLQKLKDDKRAFGIKEEGKRIDAGILARTRKQNAQAERFENEDKVRAAERELRQLEIQAATERAQKARDQAAQDKKDKAAKAKAAASAASKTIEQAGTSSRGIFNPAALLSLEGSRTGNRIAKSTEATARGIIELSRIVRANRASFN